MPEPTFVELGRRVQPEWSAERAAVARRGIARKASRQRATAVIGSVAFTAAIAVFAARWTSSHEAPVVAAHVEPAKIATPETAVEPRVTTATPLTADAKLEAEGDRAYVLQSGSARFVVTHDVEHPFTVRAGDVRVLDVGTVFTVSYVGADKLEVAVTEGIVRVDHDGTQSTLSGGERLEVDAHAHPIARAAPVKQVVRDEVAPLLQAADDARATGHPESALVPLRRVIAEHPTDSRAGVAAFTLGRVLEGELNRPEDAADAFAIARAHGGPMAADALGREVVARARAGETSRATELADEYLRLYPRGDRAREVERFASPH
jgi:hypothetical protein